MEQTDMLSELLSDPEKLKSAISMASSLLGGNTDTEGGANTAPSSIENTDVEEASMPAPAISSIPPQPSIPQPDLSSFSSLLGNFGGLSSSYANGEYDPSAELMSRAMPILSAIARSGQNTIGRDKVHLLNAMKPFVNSAIGGQLDHAMRLVSMARMARAVMGQFGSSRDTTHPDDGTREV